MTNRSRDRSPRLQTVRTHVRIQDAAGPDAPVTDRRPAAPGGRFRRSVGGGNRGISGTDALLEAIGRPIGSAERPVSGTSSSVRQDQALMLLPGHRIRGEGTKIHATQLPMTAWIDAESGD